MRLSEVGEQARAGDLDRFEAALFEDDEALREKFFTLIALNAELARTRLRVSEPHIGLIRLQWWRDAIEEAEAGRPPRAHELAAPVSSLVTGGSEGFASELIKLVDAWERELDPEPFASMDALRLHLEATASRLMRLGGFLALGRAPQGDEETAAAQIGLADGAARALAATPALAAENRSMLPVSGGALASLLRGEPNEATEQIAQELAELGLKALSRGEAAAKRLSGDVQARLKPVLLASWRARMVLRRAKAPSGALFTRLGPESPFRRRATLLLRGVLGRF